MFKFALVAALVGLASAAPTRMINDQSFVDAINAVPGITWRAGASERFTGMSLSDFKVRWPLDYMVILTQCLYQSLNGVKPGSWEAATKALKQETNDHITAIPDAFDSAKNWPQCAKVINDV